MEKTKSSLTMSQALKLYNGASLPVLTLQFSGAMIVFYLVSIAFFTLLLGLDKGFAEAHKAISEEIVSNVYMGIIAGSSTAILSALTYEKRLPGGKFFRSVKGGFATYRKMRIAFQLSIVTGICLYAGVICALNAIIPIMKHGTPTCISVALFLLLGTGIVNLINLIKNDLARSVSNILLLFACGLTGVLTVFVGEGQLGIVHIVAAILAVVLMPISHTLMLASYRKHRWDN